MIRQLTGYAALILVLFLAWTANAYSQGILIKDLRCEYLNEPLGIDVVKPRLSWALESEVRGDGQTAYRILVAQSHKNLNTGTGNLWDSGKVETNQSVRVPYAGKALDSRQRCYWKVRVWDGTDTASGWSPAGMWTMGLLKAEDWTGKWIGLDGDESGPETPLSAAKWIWFPEGAPAQSAPAARSART